MIPPYPFQIVNITLHFLLLLIKYLADTFSPSVSRKSNKNNKLCSLVERDDEIREYDYLVKREIKEGLFDEQEDRFKCDFFDDLDIMKDEESDEEKFIQEEEPESEAKNISKFRIYFFFKLNEKKEFIFPIESDSFDLDNQNVSDLIINVIKKINDKKITINYNLKECVLLLNVSEKNIYIDYELRPCNPITHAPNNDDEPYLAKNKLNVIEAQEISFVLKNPINFI